MNASTLFSGKLSNGVSLEVKEAAGFSGKTEIAVFLEGETAAVFSINQKQRGGMMEIKPSHIRTIHIKSKSEPAPELKPDEPSLGGIKR